MLLPDRFASAQTTILTVTLTNARVRISQTSDPAGHGLFSVKNTAASAWTFDGRRQAHRADRAGEEESLKVAFGKGGSYLLVSSGARTAAKATLRVAGCRAAARSAPPRRPDRVRRRRRDMRAPVSTTVTVTMYDGVFNLSQTSIPCGAVTFVTTNAGHLEHSLVLGSGAWPGLNAGETVTSTVDLAPGDLHWECGTFGHDDLGEEARSSSHDAPASTTRPTCSRSTAPSRHLCVAAESGGVAVFGGDRIRLLRLGLAYLAPEAHTVAVDPLTDIVYFRLERGRSGSGQPQLLRDAADELAVALGVLPSARTSGASCRPRGVRRYSTPGGRASITLRSSDAGPLELAEAAA